MSRRNVVFQFGMQNVKVQWSSECKMSRRNAVFNSECKGAMQFSNSECKMSRRNAVRNAKCQGAMLIISFDIRYNALEFKMKTLCGLRHGSYFWREL